MWERIVDDGAPLLPVDDSPSTTRVELQADVLRRERDDSNGVPPNAAEVVRALECGRR